VGLHHIHHLNSRIPNYRLQACLEAEPILASISRLTLRESLGCIGLALWDEERRKLVSFSDATVPA
jgi:omega-6 fatty acid desaturase (delta-12 desaturase)